MQGYKSDCILPGGELPVVGNSGAALRPMIYPPTKINTLVTKMGDLVGKNAPKVIGISGGSGSGKSTIVRMIQEAAQDLDVLVLNQDDYYHDFGRLPPADREKVNYDHPSAFDIDLLYQHLRALLNNESVAIPQYDFVHHARKPDAVLTHPREYILLDGIFSLHFPQLRELYSLKIFVDVPADLRFIRRLQRDTKERSRTAQSVVNQYLESVRPMFEEYVGKSKNFADVIVPWDAVDHALIADLRVRLERSKK